MKAFLRTSIPLNIYYLTKSKITWKTQIAYSRKSSSAKVEILKESVEENLLRKVSFLRLYQNSKFGQRISFTKTSPTQLHPRPKRLMIISRSWGDQGSNHVLSHVSYNLYHSNHRPQGASALPPVHNIGHIHNVDFAQNQFSTSHPQKQHFLKSRKCTFCENISFAG